MRINHLLFSLLVFCCVSANAQDRERLEVFGGYSYITRDFTFSVPGGASGWDVSTAVNVFRYTGVVADFSGFYPRGANPCPSCGGGPFASFNTFMGGPQFSIGVGRIKPFARFLLGATRGKRTYVDSQFGGDFSYFTYGAGGGVDFALNRWFALRGQVDWLHIASQISPIQQSSLNQAQVVLVPAVNNEARASAGLVFRY